MRCIHSTIFRCPILTKDQSLNGTLNNDDDDRLEDVYRFEVSVIVISCLLVPIGVFGNTLIVYIVPRKDMRSVCNVFVGHLAIRDIFFLLTVGIAGIVDHGVYLTYGNELQIMPLLSVYALTVTNLATSGLLVALAIDRYQSIGHPLQSRSKKSFYKAHIATAAIWIVSLLLPIVHPILKTPDRKLTWLLVVIVNTVIAYILPLATVIICYVIIFLAVRRGQQVTGESNHLTRWEFKRKIRVLRMVAYIVLLFSVAWGVWWGTNIYIALERYRDVPITMAEEVAMDVTDLLVLANSAINPVVYGLTNANFKRNLKKILCWSCAPRSLHHTSIATKPSDDFSPIAEHANYSMVKRRYSHSNGSSDVNSVRKSMIEIESIESTI